MKSQSLKTTVLTVLLVCAGYYAGGIIAIALSFPSSSSVIIWPPNAILLAALLLTPWRKWWLYLLPAIPTHMYLITNFQAVVPLVTMLCHVLANIFQVVIAAATLRRFAGVPPRFDNLRSITAFILLGAIAAPAIAAALASGFSILTGWVTEFWTAWHLRFLANVFATFTITPLILRAVAWVPTMREVTPSRWAEFGLLIIGLFAVGITAFGREASGPGTLSILLYTPLPLLLWAAVRFGPGGLCLSLLMVAFLSLSGARDGRGPFTTQSPAESVISLQVFLIAISLPLMFLATLIEERRRAEDALRKSEQRFRTFMDNSAAITFIKDGEGRHLYVNRLFEKLFRLPTGPTNRLDSELWPADVAEHLRANDLKVLSTGQNLEIEEVVPSIDGRLRYWLVDKFPIEVDGQRYIGGVAVDITERKQAEERISLLQTITMQVAAAKDLSSALEVVVRHVCEKTRWAFGQAWVPRPDGAVLDCGPAWFSSDVLEEFRAVSRRSAFPPGRGLPGRVWSSKRPAWIRDVTLDSNFPRANTARQAGLNAALAVPILSGDEVIAVIEFFMRGPRGEDERLVKVITAVAEQLGLVIERKRAEEALNQLNTQLERRIRERTAQLEAKTHELETFSYSVAHDLKAPLRGIDGYSRLLLEDYAARLDEEGRAFLNTIRSSTQRMNQLINDLLDYSRLERLAIAPRSIELSSLLETLVEEKKAEIENHKVHLTMKVNNVTVVADAEGLTQALRNYLDNAIKFSREVAEPRVEIGAEEVERNCRVWVRDNGIGFDMTYHDRIFEIFQRLHRDEDYPGTGIGLALVRKAMERMGGRAWAESAVGKGATFYLEIQNTVGSRQ
jgi:PAS domain S-box-containing protein